MNHSQPHYYPYFDYLRGILASIVMLGHDHVINLPYAASFAVQVFFALSGWLIGGILLHTDKNKLPKFYYNRALRIWIPYFIALALIVIASLMKDEITVLWYEVVSYKALFVYNWFSGAGLSSVIMDGTANHFWSVNAEEQFYLFAPLLLVLIKPSLRSNMYIWIILSVVFCMFTRYGSISLGVLAAIYAKQKPDFQLFFYTRIICIVAIIFSLMVLVWAKESEYIFYRLAPIASIAIVLLCAVRGNKTRFGLIVGGMSYPLYLNHWIGVFVGNFLLDPFGLRDSGIRQFFAVIVNYMIAVGHYLMIDRLIKNHRNSWYTAARANIAWIVAYGMVIVGVILGLILM